MYCRSKQFAVDIEQSFLANIETNYCIHCKACAQFKPTDIFPLEDQLFPWYFGRDMVDIQVISKKPLLCAVLAGGEYGLVTLPPRAKKVRCVNPHKSSRQCSHVRVYEEHNKEPEEELITITNQQTILPNFMDLDLNGDSLKSTSEEKNEQTVSCTFRLLNFPLKKDDQEWFRNLA